MKLTAPPTSASKIRNEKINLIRRLNVTFLVAKNPINNNPSVETPNFKNVYSGRKTTPTAIKAPNRADNISLLIEDGIFEKHTAKYSDSKSTVKLIKKYTSIYKVFVIITSMLLFI